MIDDNERYSRLYERLQDNRISRRTFFRLLGAAGAAAGLVGGPFGIMTPEAWAEVKQIRYDGWGGVVQKAEEKAFTKFTAKTGIKVVTGSYGSDEEFLTKVKASSPGDYNVFKCGEMFRYADAIDLGWGVELDANNIPNLKYVIPKLTSLLKKLSKNNTLSGVPNDYGCTGIAYNKNKVSLDELKEKGTKILLDKKYKKKISGWDDWNTRVWYAAAATGQNPNDIQDLDAMWNAVRQSRDVVLKYWNSGAELMALLANEEVLISDAWSGRVAALQNQGHPIGLYIPEKTQFWTEQLFVLKGSPIKACEQLLNFMLEPDVQIEVAKSQFYPPALNPTQVKLPSSVTDLPAFDKTGKLDYLFNDTHYWLKHKEAWSSKYQQVKAGY